MSESEAHVCPILMRTVIWEDGECIEECIEKDCPIAIANEEYCKHQELQIRLETVK